MPSHLSFRHRIRFCTLPWLLLASSALAAAPAESGSGLSLPAALQRAIEHDPDLIVLRSSEGAAEALVTQAGVGPAPTLSVDIENVAGTGARQGVRALEATVQANRTIERGGKREQRIALARGDQALAGQLRAARAAELQATTAVAYLEALAAQARLTLAAEPVRLARATLTDAEKRTAAGAASATEPLRARALLATAESDYARAEAELTAARLRLAATWGGGAEDLPALVGQLQLPAVVSSESDPWRNAPEHPRIALHRATVETRRAALALEQSQSKGDVTVGGGLRFLREGSDAAVVASISVPLPSRDRNAGAVRAAREHLTGAEAAVAAATRQLTAERIAAWAEAVALHRAALALESSALPAAIQAEQVVRRAYAESQASFVEVLEAQRDLLALQRERLELTVRFTLAHARAESLADPALPRTTTLLSHP